MAVLLLTGKQKRALRAMAHHFRPGVTIGKQGLAEPVLQQLEELLLANELVKVKVLKTCPEETGGLAGTITARTGAALAQRIGRTLLFYRPHPEEPVIRLPG